MNSGGSSVETAVLKNTGNKQPTQTTRPPHRFLTEETNKQPTQRRTRRQKHAPRHPQQGFDLFVQSNIGRENAGLAFFVCVQSVQEGGMKVPRGHAGVASGGDTRRLYTCRLLWTVAPATSPALSLLAM